MKLYEYGTTRKPSATCTRATVRDYICMYVMCIYFEIYMDKSAGSGQELAAGGAIYNLFIIFFFYNLF